MHAQETIRTLNRLIRSCRRAEAFGRVCSATRGAAQLRTMLRRRSEEWGRHGDELQALVLMLGGEPATGTATGGLARRTWLACKGLLLGSTEGLVLEEWHFEQQRVLNRYEEAYRHLHDLLAKGGFPDPVLGPKDPGLDFFKPDSEFQGILADLNRQNEAKRARILEIEKSFSAQL